MGLANEEVEATIEALKPVLIQHDYQRRDGTWYFFSPELVRVLDFHPGRRHSKKALLRIGLVIRALQDSTRPELHDCSVSGPLYLLLENLGHYERIINFGDTTLATTERISHIVRLVEGSALPFLADFVTVDHVRNFVDSPRSHGFNIQRATREYLSHR